MSYVELEKFDLKYLDFIYSTLYNPTIRPLWASSMRIIPREDFEDIFRRKYNIYYHSFRVIIIDSNPCGILYTSNLSKDESSVCITVLMNQNSPKGVGIQAAYQHIGYLFDKYPLEKIIIEVKPENYRCIECLDNRFIQAYKETELVLNSGIVTEYKLFSINRDDFEMLRRLMEE